MNSRTRILLLVIIGAVCTLPAAGALMAQMILAALNHFSPARIAEVAHEYPNDTPLQRAAIGREIATQLHPRWKTLPLSARVARAAIFVERQMHQQAAANVPTVAAYSGNQTIIENLAGGAVGLQRLNDCSLSLFDAAYTLGTSPTVQFSAPTLNYDKVLHTEAGLLTKGGVFAKGCVDPKVGIGSRRGAYLGPVGGGKYFLAGSGYDPMKGSNALYSGTGNPNVLTVQSGYNADLSMPGINAIGAGDLNGDGLEDVVGLDATAGSIGVWLANANGTLGTPTFYALPGNNTEAAVIADVNGDGKLDVVAATRDTAGQERISVLTGNGDGTLNAAVSMTVTTPANALLTNIIAADFRATGRPDLMGSNGIMLLNSGSGTFTQGSAAFAPGIATSDFGPNLAAGDFNNDGKVDVAYGNGATVQIYLGNGAGAFTAGNRYASISDVGYLTATDLDGDGNLDLYVGIANSGGFAGDQFEVNQAYALMGNGDGTFQGAPSEPFVYNGSNLADLNNDKALDFVGVSDATFTSYLGNGAGHFTAKAMLAPSPITVGGQQYTPSSVESYALGDINGDGFQDLVYNAGFTAGSPGGTPGLLIALGDGQGGFATPTYYPVPSTLTAGDIDVNWTISNVRLADFNRDGKADLVYNFADTSSLNNTLYFGNVVQLGNGDGTFKAPQVILYRSSPYSNVNNPSYTSQVVTIADLNKDGIPDLVFLAETGTIDTTLENYVTGIQVALGKGDGTFSTPASVMGPAFMDISAGNEASLAVADMNGDGVPDIVALGADTAYNAQVAVALGNGDGTFRAPVLTGYAAQYLNNEQGLAVGDFNGDGKLDIAISDPYTASDDGISLGNGDGTFQTITAVASALPGSLPLQIIGVNIFGAGIAADFNGDGKADILFGNTLLLSQAASSVSSGGGTPTPDFAAAVSPASGSIAPGASATTVLTIAPSGGFTGAVALTCSGLPLGAQCGFSPGSISVTSGAAMSTLTISTTAATARLLGWPPRSVDPFLPAAPLLAAMLAPAAICRRRLRVRGQRLGVCLGLVLIAVATLHGCHGDRSAPEATPPTASATPAGTYAVTVTTTSGSISHAVTYTLTIS